MSVRPEQPSALVLTPQLQQAVRMLECDCAGISEMIAEELERNPLLEQIGPPDDPGDERVVAEVEISLEIRMSRCATLRVRPDQPDVPAAPDMRQAADWFVRALGQREKLIRGLIEHVVLRDEAYFKGDIGTPKGGSVRQAAEAMAMHESTIRRVIGGKALRCTHGVVGLEALFS